MNSNQVPGFPHDPQRPGVFRPPLRVVIDLGNSVLVGAGLLVSAGAAATLLVQRIAIWGWKRYLRAQASEALPGERRMSPAMATPAAPVDPDRRPTPMVSSAITPLSSS